MGFDDLEQILEIENSSFLSPWSQRLFQEELENPLSRVFLLKRPGGEKLTVMGYICLWLVSDEAHILKIAVRPSARRKGVASMLLQFALDYSCRRNIVKAVLEVREHNHPARCFYSKCGFVLVGVRPRYYEDTKEDALILGRDLRTFSKVDASMKKRIPEMQAS